MVQAHCNEGWHNNAQTNSEHHQHLKIWNCKNPRWRVDAISKKFKLFLWNGSCYCYHIW